MLKGALRHLAHADATHMPSSGTTLACRAMAISLAPHDIRVNAVAPGSIATEMLDHVRRDPASWRLVLSRTPMLRAGLPAEIANVSPENAQDTPGLCKASKRLLSLCWLNHSCSATLHCRARVEDGCRHRQSGVKPVVIEHGSHS